MLDRSEWVTYREAAELLGVHVSLIPKMLRRGDLTSRRQRPALSRAQVLDLAAARQRMTAERAQREADLRQGGPRPPDDDHEWLLGPAAAAVLGCSEGALGMRANRGQVPFMVHCRRRWYRLDLLELLVRARVARDRGQVSR
jgi:hypothetical protein